MRVGSIVFATDQGLGILAKSFYDAGVVTDVVVVRHGRRPEHDEWYPGARRIGSLVSSTQELYDFVKSVDAMLFFETPFNWELIQYCRAAKVRTVLMPMYECMPEVLPYQPDKIICPSLLDLKYYPQGEFIPVPVDVRWRKRFRAETFVHNAGHGGLRGRNGTKELLEAIHLVKVPAKFIIRSQEPLSSPTLKYATLTLGVEVIWEGPQPYEKLWDDGDVFVFPEKFNGLSLPLQEARAAGMGVMCTERFPMTTWLPTMLMIPSRGAITSRVSGRCQPFQEAVVSPRDIADTINKWYGANLESYSEMGRQWAAENSWEVLRPRYLEALS